MRLTYLKSNGIAPYVHHPLKDSVECVFEVFGWRLPQICKILARTVLDIEVAN